MTSLSEQFCKLHRISTLYIQPNLKEKVWKLTGWIITIQPLPCTPVLLVWPSSLLPIHLERISKDKKGEMFFDWFVYEMFTKKEKCKEEKWKLLRILSISISCPSAALVCVKWTLSYQHSSFCVLELWVQNSGSVKASEAFSKNPVLEN